MEKLNPVAQALIEYLKEKYAGKMNKIILISKAGRTLTPNEIIKHIEGMTPEGVDFLRGLYRLAIDLLARGKERLPGFEVITQ